MNQDLRDLLPICPNLKETKYLDSFSVLTTVREVINFRHSFVFSIVDSTVQVRLRIILRCITYCIDTRIWVARVFGSQIIRLSGGNNLKATILIHPTVYPQTMFCQLVMCSQLLAKWLALKLSTIGMDTKSINLQHPRNSLLFFLARPVFLWVL